MQHRGQKWHQRTSSTPVDKKIPEEHKTTNIAHHWFKREEKKTA